MAWNLGSGAGVRSLAPDAFSAVDTLRACVPGPVDALLSSADRACVDLAEQFVVDVSSITDPQRQAVTLALGSDTFAFAQALYVADYGSRLDAAWPQIFGVEVVTTPTHVEPVELWPALEAFLAAVGRLDLLDPVTTELVRLRGARAHNCRLCKSLRNARAADLGADESSYDKIDAFEASDLPERQKVALRLTDAILWSPAAYPPELPAQLQARFSAAEVVEIVLDVARNAANKIAVALGADEAHVSEGVEYYDIDASGRTVYGLSPAGESPP